MCSVKLPEALLEIPSSEPHPSRWAPHQWHEHNRWKGEGDQSEMQVLASYLVFTKWKLEEGLGWGGG